MNQQTKFTQQNYQLLLLQSWKSNKFIRSIREKSKIAFTILEKLTTDSLFGAINNIFANRTCIIKIMTFYNFRNIIMKLMIFQI